MTAKEALIAFGYVQDIDNAYRRRYTMDGRAHFKRTHVWREVEGGWTRSDYNAEGEEEQIPYRVSDLFQSVAGLDFHIQRDAFDWIWPEEHVLRSYQTTVESETARLEEALAVKEAQQQTASES